MPERILHDGRVELAVTTRALAALARRVRRTRPDAVAICLLHSYANPRHERAVARALAPLAVPISQSHALVREYREYERLSTTVVNAYVAPLMTRHLRTLAAGVPGRLHIMQSSGGVIGSVAARREPVRTVLSGPAGGVVGAAAIARRSGAERIMTLDMGGTSTDVCLIDGAPARRTETAIGGLPIRFPVIDIHTVGAGGGSIARLDAGGSLKVGPESAGADPGPACYGRGTAPTVTDANLVLGRLVPSAFLGGALSIDTGRARRAVRALATEAGMGLEAAAEGIVRVVNASMERALRVISVERGLDPREFTLVAFGGAAGLHACALAEALGFPRVLVPPDPGLLSAWGMVTSDLVKDYATTVLRTAETVSRLTRIFTPLVRRARRDMIREGIDPRTVVFVRTLDARYPGQAYEIEVPLGHRYAAAFHRAHERRYGTSDPHRAVEVVTARLRAVAGVGVDIAAASRPTPRTGIAAAPPAIMRWQGTPRATAILDRAELGSAPRPGPAIVYELSATTCVPPGWTVRAESAGTMVIEPVTTVTRARRER
jgi:N-methylhydantoinase A